MYASITSGASAAHPPREQFDANDRGGDAGDDGSTASGGDAPGGGDGLLLAEHGVAGEGAGKANLQQVDQQARRERLPVRGNRDTSLPQGNGRETFSPSVDHRADCQGGHLEGLDCIGAASSSRGDPLEARFEHFRPQPGPQASVRTRGRQKGVRKKGKKVQKKRKRSTGQKAKRGKAREEEVNDFWRAVDSADVSDYAGSYFDLGPWCSVAVLPRFSDGRRWVAGGQSSVDGRVGVRVAATTFHSRRQRLGAVADAAGIDGGVMARAGLRMGKRRRLEEGGDVSGVT